MYQPRRHRALLAGLTLLTTGSAGPTELALAEAERKAFAKEITGYFEALDAEKGAADALAEVSVWIEKTEKKKKVSVLRLVDDLAASLELVAPTKASPQPGKPLEREFRGWGGAEVTYVVHAPRAYTKTKEGGYPLLLCIPDQGEKAKEHLEATWSGTIRDDVILAVCSMPADAATWGANGSEEAPGGRAVVLQILKAVCDEFRIDKGRVSLAGRGAGVAAVLEIAAASPHTFAAVVGRSGEPRATPVACFRNLPVLLTGGGAGATAFEARAKEAGIESVTLAPEGQEADVTTWLADKERVDYPTRVSFVPLNETARSAYWIELEGFDATAEASVDATIDRATNTISVTGRGILSVRIDFNDAMLDLDKPVAVVCNGMKQEDLLPRSLKIALDTAYKSADPQRIVVARKKYDLPAAE